MALPQLHADGLITLDRQSAHAVKDLVTVAHRDAVLTDADLTNGAVFLLAVISDPQAARGDGLGQEIAAVGEWLGPHQAR